MKQSKGFLKKGLIILLAGTVISLFPQGPKLIRFCTMKVMESIETETMTEEVQETETEGSTELEV